MSTELARGSVRQYTNLLVKSLRLILFVMLPATAFGIVLRRQIITLLFDYGKFDAYAVDLTADALFFFLLGLASESLLVILARAFYAGRDTLTPVVAAVIAVIVNVTIGVATVGTLGLPGLALGLAVGSWIETTILVVILWRRVPGFDVRSLADAGVRSGICAIAAGLAMLGASRGVEAALGFDLGKPALAVQVAIAGSVGALVFLGLARLLRIPELPDYPRAHAGRAAAAGRVTEDSATVLLATPLPGVGAADPWDAFVASNVRGSYLQTGGWAAVKAPNGWGMRRVLAESPDGPIGAQILLRRPRPVPWTFGYAPRGPVAAAWTGESLRDLAVAIRAEARISIDRLSHVRIDPEVEIDGPDDPDGAARRALAAAGFRPAPPIQPDRTRDRGPPPVGRRPLVRPAQEVAAVRQPRPGRGRGRAVGGGRRARRVLRDLPRDCRAGRVPHPDARVVPGRLGRVPARGPRHAALRRGPRRDAAGDALPRLLRRQGRRAVRRDDRDRRAPAGQLPPQVGGDPHGPRGRSGDVRHVGAGAPGHRALQDRVRRTRDPLRRGVGPRPRPRRPARSTSAVRPPACAGPGAEPGLDREAPVTAAAD